ncbi:MAG TPA: PAS domain-containing protein, partial [Streptomyces sp.]|nr:PAS domain-containing protein [Streptomyces sp.]
MTPHPVRPVGQNAASLERELAAFSKRISMLRGERVADRPDELAAALDLALAELETAEEELRTSREELDRQSEQLALRAEGADAEWQTLRNAFRELPVPVVLLDEAGRVHRANAEAARLVGRPAGLLTGRLLAASVHVGYRRGYRSALTAARRGERPDPLPLLLTRPGGSTRVRVQLALLATAPGARPLVSLVAVAHEEDEEHGEHGGHEDHGDYETHGKYGARGGPGGRGAAGSDSGRRGSGQGAAGESVRSNGADGSDGAHRTDGPPAGPQRAHGPDGPAADRGAAAGRAADTAGGRAGGEPRIEAGIQRLDAVCRLTRLLVGQEHQGEAAVVEQAARLLADEFSSRVAVFFVQDGKLQCASLAEPASPVDASRRQPDAPRGNEVYAAATRAAHCVCRSHRPLLEPALPSL